VSCYIVQETDGVSRFTLEDGTGFLILEDCVPAPPGGDLGAGGQPRKGRRRRLELIGDDEEWLAVVLAEL